jgi:hypothetical protein
MAIHRSPAAALALAFETARPDRAALEEAAESIATLGSIRTVVELLADAASLATADRVVGWLDQLVHEGHLRATQRAALAAEDGATSLTRLLRRVELAGHDPWDVLRDAVTARHLEDARQLTNVLHHRITASVPLDPIGDRFSDWVPRAVPEQWTAYLAELAAAADAKTTGLARAIADNPPAWARHAFGPVPEDATQRENWARRAAVVAAHREICGHDDPATALGSPPAPGQPELFASWRAACRALGREEAAREESELSNGQLRLRVRAWEREQTWAPAYVADELAGTCEAAQAHRATCTLLLAESQVASDEAERERLREAARDSAALADALDARSRALREADHARALWYAHTAANRVAGERAADELDRRRIDSEAEPAVTAEEWLRLHRQHVAAEDRFRVVPEAEDDVVTSSRAGERVVRREDDGRAWARVAVEPVGALEDDVPGARRLAAALTRVPDADETAAILARAREALAVVAWRDALDREYEAMETHRQPSYDERARLLENGPHEAAHGREI